MFRPFRAFVVVLLALGLSLVAAGTARAQYSITTWTADNGLPQNSVVDVAQTPDGFLWIATLGGLVRFDGQQFLTFDTTTNPELPGSRFRGLLVDGHGRLWAWLQTWEVFYLDEGRFRQVETPVSQPRAIRRMRLDAGRIVLETPNETLVWREDHFGIEPTVTAPPGVGELRYAGRAWDERVRWYRDEGGLLYRYEGNVLSRTISMPGVTVYEDQTGRLWSSGPAQFFSLEHDVLTNHVGAAGVLAMVALSVHEDPDGTLWFRTSHGLMRYRNGGFSSLTADNGLPHNTVRTTLRDLEGALWVGTERGIARLIDQPIQSVTSETGLQADNTYPILQDRHGTIWIGGWRGLTQYRDGKFEQVAAKYGVGGRMVLSFAEDRDGAIWIGTLGAGLRKVTGDRVEEIIPPTGRDIPRTIHTILFEGRDNIWLGTNRGVLRYQNGTFTLLSQTGRTAPRRETSALHRDRSGTLWVGNLDGLARVVDDKLVQIGKAEGFDGNRVRAIHEDEDGTLWLGTYDTGLFRYRSGQFSRLTVREGLPTNGAFRILNDDQGHFWISSNVGIYRVEKAALNAVADGRESRLTAVLYGAEDGMASQECNGLGQPAGIRASDGRFWFPTQGGVAIVDPSALRLNPVAPPISILEVSVGGTSADRRDRVELRPGTGGLQVRYGAVSFVHPELLRFRYRLEGLDPDWIDVGTDRAVRFGELPTGSFRFLVTVANRDGVWNSDPAVIDVVVIPPFYRTPWFAGMTIVSLALVGFGAHRTRVGRIERGRAAQEAFSRRLIESQEADRARIASSLHDGLQQSLIVIKNWALMGKGRADAPEVARKTFADMEEAAAQALDEVREAVHDLVPYNLARVGLAESLEEMTNRIGEAGGVNFTCTLEEPGDKLSVEAQTNLFRILQEAVNNIVKHAGATEANLTLEVGDRTVVAMLKDNGRGLPAGDTPRKPGRTGFGLNGMVERARLAGGHCEVSSAPGAGTTIRVELPVATKGTSA